MGEPLIREHRRGIEAMRRGAIGDLRRAAELIDKCELERNTDQLELEAIALRLREVAARLSAEAVLKVAEV